jgi:uncharacterized circularly permuted ATP-grasp superfamily protein
MNRDVCLVNPFRCKIMHKKASFELLTDEAHESWFTSKERSAIARSIPWTRRMMDRRTTYHGHSVELVEFVRGNRARLVLKPNDDYGGHGVYFGPQLDERAWENAIATALSSDYVVQEAIDLSPEQFPIFNQTEWKLQPMGAFNRACAARNCAASASTIGPLASIERRMMLSVFQ